MNASIEDLLMVQAKEVHENRLSSEFGPGGGNPKAKLEESLEYKAAQKITKLKELCRKAVRMSRSCSWTGACNCYTSEVITELREATGMMPTVSVDDGIQ